MRGGVMRMRGGVMSKKDRRRGLGNSRELKAYC